MGANWVDLVDPTREELSYALPGYVDPEVVEALAAPHSDVREPRPLVEGHGAYVFGVLVAISPERDRLEHREVDFVATKELLVTVRKSPPDGAPFEPVSLYAASEQGAQAGVLVHRLVDDVADTYLELVDGLYARIDALEDQIDDIQPAAVRRSLSELRHDLTHRRRTAVATRAAVRRVLDGRVDIGDHALFPREVEQLFGDTYDSLLRVTEELDLTRDLLAGLRGHHQARISETQNDIVKKLTVIASIVLVPSLIVGFYGQNFESAFGEDYWSLGVSMGLILASTILQLVLYRWRRWI